MPVKKYFCTYFDYNFLPRGLALYHSIKRIYSDFDFYILAFDKQTHEKLNNLNDQNIKVISFEEYDKYFNTSIDRFEDKKQYYFSATPNICLYLLEKRPEIDLLLYLDADVFVFNSLDTLYQEVKEASIAFCSHRFYPLYKFLSKNHGMYNVGVNFFRNDENAKVCLRDWHRDCNSWYKGMPGYKLGYFSDQIFLNDWKNKYNRVKIIENIGIDVAPWNIANYCFSSVNGQFYVNDVPLVIYHFSYLKKIEDNRWNANTIFYFGSVRKRLLDIYLYYIKELEASGQISTQVASIQMKFSLPKKLFYRFMRLFLNETIHTK